MEELFELKLVNIAMESYEKIFLELLKYEDFVKDEKVKYQILLSTGLPDSYREKI